MTNKRPGLSRHLWAAVGTPWVPGLSASHPTQNIPTLSKFKVSIKFINKYLIYFFCQMGSKNGKPILRDEDVVSLAKTSGLSDKEIRDAFESFVKEHPKGQMKPKDFRQLMSSALPKKDASKMEKHVFRIYDTNNDGHVDFVEFMVVYTIMAGGTEEEVLTKIFRYLIIEQRDP